MLETLRKSAGGTIAKIFIGLLVISFGIWGIGDVFRGFSGRDVAQVGSTKIDTELFRLQYQEQLQQLSRQLGRGLSPAEAAALGLDRQLLGQVISEAALDERTKQLGLNIDQATLLDHIHSNPAFAGPTGQFEPFRFYEALRSAGYTEARYVDSERRLILRQQLARALGGDVAAPNVLRDAVRRFENEERAVDFVVLGRDQAKDIPAPTPAQIDAFFEERKASFRAPEYRKLAVIALTPETMADESKITDAELRKAFEERRDRLAVPERREVEQIVFPNSNEAQAASERLEGGMKFDELVKERGLKPTDVSLGLVAKGQILDPAVADAVFALPEGQVSKPVTGRFGTVIARVLRIEPGKQPEFSAVADSLRKELAVARARNEILDQHDRIEDERAAGSRLPEVASKLGIKLITIDAVDRSGRAPDGKPITAIPAFGEVVSGAFSTDVGVETDPVESDNGNSFVWYEVLGVTAARDRTLDEVRERVEAAWRDEQIGKQVSERAEAIRAKLDAGESFAAAAPDLKVETREKIRRGRSVDGLDRAALAAIFETAQGKAGIAVADDRVGRTVFRVTGVNVPPATEETSQTIAQLGIGIQDDLLVQYVLNLQSELGVTVNEAALRTITGNTGN